VRGNLRCLKLAAGLNDHHEAGFQLDLVLIREENRDSCLMLVVVRGCGLNAFKYSW
jgi:hypothetical protein